MDGPVGIASPPSTWTVDAAYAYATKRAVPPTDPDGEPLYNCPFPRCAKQFSKRFNLKAHLRVHTGDKPFACNFQGCTRRFMWKSSLTSHQAGHSRRKQELQKRNAVMAGKALAAESVQNPPAIPIASSSSPFSRFPDHFHHHQHHQIHPSQTHSQQVPDQQQSFHHPLHQHRHLHQQQQQHQQQLPFQTHPQLQQQQQQQQSTPHPHAQHHQPHSLAPSLHHHPTAMYDNTPSQSRLPPHHVDSRHFPPPQQQQQQQQQLSHNSPTQPFSRNPSAEPSPALSFITTEEANNSQHSSRPPVSHSHPQHHLQLQRQQPDPHRVHHHQLPPHNHQKSQKRPSDPFMHPRHHQDAPQRSKQPRHHSDTSVQRPAPPHLEPPSSQRTSLVSQRSINQEPTPAFYNREQQARGQQRPQLVRHDRDEPKALAAEHVDQQKLLQDEHQQLKRQEQELEEQQRLLRQKQEHNEEERRRIQEMLEEQERHRRELERRQNHLVQCGSQKPTASASDSLLNRNPTSAAPVDNRQDSPLPLPPLEESSRALRPTQRTSIPALSPTLGPLSGAGRNDGVQLKPDTPSALAKPPQPTLTSPASLGLSSGLILPSPTASMGMTRSPNGFSQQFLFPSHATSPTWATTPTAPAPVSMTLASPKAPPTPNSLMDVQMATLHADHAGDMSPVPSDVAVSPGIVNSPVPPPIQPQISTTSRPRRPVNHAKPPLAGPSLSSGPSALLPPLTNVAPANPPTHIDLRGVLEDEGPSCSLPALGSPHTDMSPLPVASPIFGNGHTPISPMQPFSPFSGNNSASARGKYTTTW